MTLAGVAYSATFVGQEGDTYIYRVEEWKVGRVTRTVTGRLSGTQRARARGSTEHSDLRLIERWCELHPQKLPEDGGTVDIDLSSVHH
jgi:hypothetical protein